MCEEIIQKNSSWFEQCGQVHHWIEVGEHYIGQCPHLQGERNCVQWLIFEIATEEFRHWLKRIQSIIVLDRNLLRRWTNFHYLLDWVPRDKEFSLPYLTTYALPFHKGISKEFPCDFAEDISTWVQQLCPCSLLEHFRNEGVFKGLYIDNLFHDDRGPFVEVIVGQVCLNASEIFRFRAWTL